MVKLRENFCFKLEFQILWLIRGMEIIKKIQNFSSVISITKIILLGQKTKHGDMECEYHYTATFNIILFLSKTEKIGRMAINCVVRHLNISL